jgi:chromate reductase
MPRLLTLAGSLRSGSSNAALLTAAAVLAPANVTVAEYPALAALPAFNPDVDDASHLTPSAVTHWRAALAAADMLLISSPEYAHGIPGALKNALDWVVGSGELVGKPVGVINASAASRFAFPQLIEVLSVMNATVVPDATLVLDIPRRGAGVTSLATDPAVAAALRGVLAALLAAVPERDGGSSTAAAVHSAPVRAAAE